MKNILFIFFSLFCSSQLICSDINWTFPPQALSSAGASAADPHIAMDSNGNAVAIWIENGIVKSKYKLLNMDWGPVAILSGSEASSPSVVQDPNGNSTAIWIESGVVKASSKTFKQAWGNPVNLSNSNAINPSLAVDIAGNVVAVWSRSGNIESFSKKIGFNWQNTGSINISGSTAVCPDVAIGGSGPNATAYVVCHSKSGSRNVIYASSKLITSNGWSSAVVISESELESAYAQVAADRNGNATAVWYNYNVNGPVYFSVVVQSASLPSGGNWSSPVSLSEPGMRDPATLAARVACDNTGNVVALWSTSFDNETFSIQSAIKPLYGRWNQPIGLIEGNLYSFQTDLSLCSLGDALALYLFYNGNALQIQSSELDITGFTSPAWSVPLTISSGTQNAFPALAATLAGNVIHSAAVWLVGSGINNAVVAATGSKTLVLPPSELAVAQSANNFGVFGAYYNTLSWQASADPDVVGYIVYRNGVFLQQVGSDVLEIVDDNRVQNGSVVYGVASLDSQGSHSQIITVAFP